MVHPEAGYVLRLNRVGVVWSICVAWTVPADKVQDRVNRFLKGHAEAKEVKADDPLPRVGS